MYMTLISACVDTKETKNKYKSKHEMFSFPLLVPTFCRLICTFSHAIKANL